MKLSNLKISVKIMLLLAMLGIVTIGVAAYGSYTLKSADAQYNELVDVQLPGSIKMARANRQAVEMIYAGYRALAYETGPRIAEAGEVEAESYRAASAALSEVVKAEPKFADRIDAIREKLDTLHAETAQAVKLGAAGRNDEARAVLARADDKMVEFSKTTRAFNEMRVAESDKTSNDLNAAANHTSTMMLVASVLGLAIALGIALFVSRGQITGPIAKLQDAMATLASGKHAIEVPGTERGDEIGVMAKSVLVFRDAAVREAEAAEAKRIADAEQKLVVDTLEDGLGKLAAGDLTAEIHADFSPTYASVKTNFNQALAALRDLIGAVLESTASIQTGSTEIAQASEDLARRTEANAASLEETSAAITQMDDRLKASATASSRTVERADGAIATVSGGRGVASEAVQAMSRVAEGAKGIDSVIEGLDKIAFQTRVLAMNAAVEAGRAGEAGRGFAVVADLVSALAMRSEEEAARARDQLTATQTDIADAVVMVEKVDGALANISGDVSEVHTLLGQMASDNQAQSTAITQINVAVGTMDTSTQQNAAMVEQTSAAARNLTGEVTALAERASRFRTGREGVRGVTASYASPVKPLAPRASAPSVAQVKSVAIGQDDWTSF